MIDAVGEKLPNKFVSATLCGAAPTSALGGVKFRECWRRESEGGNLNISSQGFMDARPNFNLAVISTKSLSTILLTNNFRQQFVKVQTYMH